MDDFSVCGSSFDTCLVNLECVLKRCQETNLIRNREKCHFVVDEGIVLVHKVSKKGIEVDPAKVSIIEKLPPPNTVTGVRAFLRHAGFYGHFMSLVLRLLKTLKKALISAPIVQAPDWSLPFEVMCDASDFAVGVVLGQRKEGRPHVIA